MITATAMNTEILPPRIGIVGILDVYKRCENNLNTLQIFLDFWNCIDASISTEAMMSIYIEKYTLLSL